MMEKSAMEENANREARLRREFFPTGFAEVA
jgi:hypothetical protein